MKMIKFFGISYFVNFVASLSFIALIIYTIIERQSDNGNLLIISAFFSAFLLIVVPFDWICYSLHKTYKSSQQLSKKGRIAGLIFFILFSMLTILEMIGSADIITNVFTRQTFRDIRLFSFALSFLSATITAICLCISYWIIRKQARIQFTNIIAQLGDDTAS